LQKGESVSQSSCFLLARVKNDRKTMSSKKSSKSSSKGSKRNLDPELESIPTKVEKKGKAVITGIPYWYEYVDETSGRPFFRHKLSKERRWGIPLRDVLKHPLMKGPPGEDDWECHVDPKTFRRFYSSKMYKKLQWKVPHLYSTTVGKLPFFKDEYVKQRLAERNRKIIERNDGVTAREIIKNITLLDALDNNTTCAAFHRFLVASYAEENLLFCGAVEIFEKGKWKGMKVLGVEMKNALDADLDEGTDMLQKQLAATRASFRLGLEVKPKSMKDEAKIIYDKFVKADSDLWVCVSEEIKSEIEKAIEESDDTTDLRSVFETAKTQVYDNMIEELFPRFITLALDEDELTGFTSDEILRATLLDMAGFKNEYLSRD